MKKGQMEVFGLVMIAIIASVFILYMLVNSGQNPDQRQHQTFQDKSLSSKFVNVMINTHIEACNAQYSTIVKDCVRGGSIACGGRPACYWVENTTTEITNRTLDVWDEKYKLTIRKNEDNPMFRWGNNCTDIMEKEAPGLQLIPLYPSAGNARIMLEICK